jgi:tetratricopeptide (TPR) repeat protein
MLITSYGMKINDSQLMGRYFQRGKILKIVVAMLNLAFHNRDSLLWDVFDQGLLVMADDIENFLLIEKALIRGKWDAKISESSLPSIQLAKLVVECRFREVLKSQQALSLFRLSSHNTDLPFEDVLASKTTAFSMSEELTRLVLAIAFLHAFVQANWTGPDIDIHPLVFFTNDDGVSKNWTEELIHTKSVQELAHGGEPAYHLSKVPTFLRFAQILISLPYKHIHSISLWKLRVASVHLQVLDETVALHEDFHMSLQPLLINFASEADLSGRIHLELGILEHLLTRDKLAAEHFLKAARSTELEYELSGALGKRTKFQVTEVAQLVLLAESHLKTESEKDVAYDSETGVNNNIGKTLPETLALNDDTLLEQTEFTSSRPGKSGSSLNHINPSFQPSLHPLDQCILISLCLNIRNTSPSHGLTTEQMHPYVSRVISQPKNWSVHTMALLLRSRLESSRTRTVERSTLQLQALIDQMSSSDSTTCERLLYFHTILLPPKWELERELAQRYLSLGVVKSALEIFERLEMWEDVVKCYGALQMPEKGIAIVRDLLEGEKGAAGAITSRGEETSMPSSLTKDATRQAKLLCLLGDLEPANAIAHYEKAWIVSNETSGRAMRSLGGYYFAQAKYREAIECLRKALKINPLFEKTWFILGCACMRIEDWEEAKNAFGRCVAINEEDGESWNNLASMYLRMGETAKVEASKDQLSSSLEVSKMCLLQIAVFNLKFSGYRTEP